MSDQFSLSKTEGWWNSIVADDLDGDGDVDLIAGNLGENYKFKTSVDKPFQVYAKDFDGNGTNDVFLARYYQDSKLVPIRGKECSSQQMPVINAKFPTYRSFAQSDLQGILGEEMNTAMHYEAHMFSSVILENDKGRLKIRRLPVEAQLSTVNAIIAKDFDGDGIKDLLLAGNKFDVEVETTAADASPGLFLRGSHNLTFKSYKPLASGFFVPYNVKDMRFLPARDGWFVIVSVNNEPLRIFRNYSPDAGAIALNKP